MSIIFIVIIFYVLVFQISIIQSLLTITNAITNKEIEVVFKDLKVKIIILLLSNIELLKNLDNNSVL